VLDQNGDDVLQITQAVSNPYPTQNGQIDPLIARQTANVLSDYGARSRSVWGNSLRNLQLAGWEGANTVAAKTGTTSDVKDTWTVGGTPYYTIGVWAGNTDGKAMRSNVASSTTAAPIWQELMQAAHEGKTPRGFSTQGLEQIRLDPRTGLIAESGNVELLTRNQVTALGKATANLSRPDFDPAASSIFENRSSVVFKTQRVYLGDNLLVPEDKLEAFPAELIEDRQCLVFTSFFPRASSWFNPVQEFAKNQPPNEQSCPSEFTTVDPASLGITLETNLIEGEKLPDSLVFDLSLALPNDVLSEVTVTINTRRVDLEDNTATSITLDTDDVLDELNINLSNNDRVVVVVEATSRQGKS
jgi:hypothetical protein